MQKGAERTHIKWPTAFADRSWVDAGGGGWERKKVCVCLALGLAC